MDLVRLTLRELTSGFNNGTGTASGENAGVDSVSSGRSTLRRCRTREQGMALITISHAIEYLLDSRLLQPEKTSDAEREALAILLAANLSVYQEGAEIKSPWSRLRQWFHGGSTRNKVAGVAA